MLKHGLVCLLVAATLLDLAFGSLELAIAKRSGRIQNVVKKRWTQTNTFDIATWLGISAFYVNVTVGTPPQPQTVILSTASSDFYVDASLADTCLYATPDPAGCPGGTFSPSKSSTFEDVSDSSDGFNASFTDGTYVSGPYVTDNIGIGNLNISGVQFGLGENLTTTNTGAIGTMGLGYTVTETLEGNGRNYPNIPDVLYAARVTQSRLFSIYLGSTTSESGAILFGAIDKSRYAGQLVAVNFMPSFAGDSTITYFTTTITEARATISGNTTSLWYGGVDGIKAYESSPESTSNYSMPVYLDTGFSYWTVPPSIYSGIKRHFPYVDSQGHCGCSEIVASDYLTLIFASNVPIQVKASDLFTPLINSTTREPIIYNFTTNDTTCIFQIIPDGDEGAPFDLGEAVLRSMYVVFDLDNKQAFISQAAVDVTEEPEIVEVPPGLNGVAWIATSVVPAVSNTWPIISLPSTIPATYTVNTLATPIGTATDLAAIPIDGQIRGTSTGSASSTVKTSATSPTSTGSAGGSSTNGGAIAGGVVGGLAGLALIVGAIVFLLKSRQKKFQGQEFTREMETS